MSARRFAVQRRSNNRRWQSPLCVPVPIWLLSVVVLALSLPALAATPSRQYAYDLNGRLWRAMDASGTLLTYGYDEVGNITKISRDKVDPSFNVLGALPLTGGAGDKVTLQGDGFDTTLTNDTVQIGGVDATVVSVDASGRTMVVQVPWGAESGPVSVTVGAKTTTAPEDFTVVHYGDSGIRGTLVGGTTSSYTLELAVGQSVQIRLVDPNHTAFYPNVALQDPAEKQVATANAADVAALSYTAVTAGSFQIAVSDASSQKIGGDFILYYAVAPGSNEGGALNPNNPIDETIDLGDIDSYTFDATVGQSVQLRMADVGATALYPYMIIYDPTGKVVNYGGNYDVCALSLTPATSGKYTVVALDGGTGSAGTGAYKLYYSVAPGSNEGGALDPNNPISGRIDEGDIDTYTFDATVGQSVELRMVDVGATALYPYMIIYDPTGKVVNYGGNYDVCALSLTPATSGKYSIAVLDGGTGNAGTGAYEVYYSIAPGSNDGGALNPNAPIVGTIDEGDIDSYTFDATAGRTVVLRVTDVAATALYPYMLIFDPTGKEIAHGGNYDVASLQVTPAVSGKYTVVVLDGGSGSAGTGEYEIYFAEAVGSNDGGTLDPNNPVGGTLDEGDLDTYTFDVTVGGGVQLRVLDVNHTSLYPYFYVYDPNGALVGQAGAYDVAALGFAPAVSGTYTLLVLDGGTGSAGTGAYQVYYTLAPGSSEGGALDPTNPIAGVIDEGDLDSYSFDLTAGSGVQLRVADVNATSFYPYVMVYDPTGKLVGQAGGYDDAAYSFAAGVSGRYTAVVFDGSSGYAASGAYNLYYTVAPGSNEGGLLTPGTPVAGTIDEGDLDAYTFSAAAGNKFTVAATDVNATAFVPGVLVYGPTGAVVASVSGPTTASASVTTSTAGTYTVVVYDASSGFAASGAYSLSLTQN